MFAAMSVKRIFLSVICLSCFLSAHAGQGADSVRIYYRAGYRYVEPGFRDNRAALDRLVRYIGEARSAGRLERISIRSYASPDGANRANELLSERRADSLSSWIVRHSSVSASLIDRQAAGIAWDELRAQVAASGMPYRDEVLDVLDNTPVWIFDEKNRVVGGRKQRLMDLRRRALPLYAAGVLPRPAKQRRRDIILPVGRNTGKHATACGRSAPCSGTRTETCGERRAATGNRSRYGRRT